MKKRLLALFLSLFVLFQLVPLNAVATEEKDTPTLSTPEDPNCKSALLMDADSGKILYAKNENEAYPPASVTKIMTLLLIMEEIEAGRLSLSDEIVASEHACSMGGSQIYLKVGEVMSAEDMIKSVVISSANDAAVALAEFVAGSEEAFVERMNKRAEELGMKNAQFENTNGLDDTVENHVTSARDIALMSRELIKHETILKYSSIWMDTIRDGAFGLTNTNRLVRFYKDATGLKTGSTAKAGFCVSATAKRDSMHLICVVMGAETRDIRNAIATKLLDYGFANYALYHADGTPLDEVKVLGGVENTCGVAYGAFDCVMAKGAEKKVSCSVEIEETIAAPVKVGDVVGKVTYRAGDRVLGVVPILATEEIAKIDFKGLFVRMLAGFFVK